MPFRSDVIVNWALSPRIVLVEAPSTSITIQDLVDTLRTLEDDLDNIDDDYILDASGKEELEGGVYVGITAVLNNAHLQFEDRATPTSEGTVTTGGTTILTDATANFIVEGVTRGAVIVNLTDGSACSVIDVLSATQLYTTQLAGGVTNDWTIADDYNVWATVQCEVQGGNLLAVDDMSVSINPILPSAFTQVVRTSSTGAALVDGAAEQTWESLNQTWAAGTMGEKMNKLLTFAKYIGLK